MSDDDNNWARIIRAFMVPLQRAEDALASMLVNRSVDTAVGAQLDLVGKIVGQARAGLDDDTYRRYIRARIRANKSNGTIEDLIIVTRLVVGDDAATIEVDNQGEAGCVIRVLDVAITNNVANVVITFLNQARSGGTRVILESSTYDPSTWMRHDLDLHDTKRKFDARDGVRA